MEVDTKFVERHQGILRTLLDFLLPKSAKTNADRFEERFGLRYDEPLIRLRFLDSGLKSRLGLLVDDFAVPRSQFCAFNWDGLTAIIAENKMTFLTLPPTANGLGIWGGGGAAELLASAAWLTRCRLFYWGDIDVHGFHILSRLRHTFPSIVSLLMNDVTLQALWQLAVAAKEAVYQDVSGLTQDEQRAYQLVCAGRLLLEQEKIPQNYAVREIQTTLDRVPTGCLV